MEHRPIGWAALSSGLAALTLGCAQLQAQPPTPEPAPYGQQTDSSTRLAQAPTVNENLTQAQLYQIRVT